LVGFHINAKGNKIVSTGGIKFHVMSRVRRRERNKRRISHNGLCRLSTQHGDYEDETAKTYPALLEIRDVYPFCLWDQGLEKQKENNSCHLA
jgi:hypothetical protein